VIVKYTNPQTLVTTSQTTTVKDIGPPPLNNAYWSTGTIPIIGGCISDALANALGVSNGCGADGTPFGEATVLWRFQ
jgi:hypothetical protein